MARFKPDSSVDLYYDANVKFQTTSTGVTISGSDTTGSVVQGDFRLKKADATQHIVYDASNARMNFADSVNATFGNSNDMQLYHDGTTNYIECGASNFALRVNSGNRFEVNGTSGDVTMQGSSGKNFLWDNSAAYLNLNDNARLTLGTGNDLFMYHNGSNTIFDQNGTGNLFFQVGGANTSTMRLELFGDSTTASRICLGTEEMITAAPNGAVSLYYDNSKKLETTSIGITLFGDLKIPDNEELRLGDGNDLQIYHNGSNTYLDSNTGNLYFRGSGGQMLFRPNNAEDALILKPDGAVELYYNNSKKLETTNDGVDVTGNFKAIGGSTEVQIQPADGLINFGMDGRSSFVTGTNACNIYSGSGSSGDMPAGDLILQSRSNVNRTIRFVTGSSPAQRMSIDSGGLKFGTDTADANALNDYEEGTWTPTTANSGGGFTNIISATYTKIGRLVNVSVYAVFDSSQPNSNQVRIGGLPFASISTIYH